MRLARVMAKLEPGGAQLSALRLVARLRDCGVETRLLVGSATSAGISLCETHGVAPEVFGERADLQYACSRRFARWLEPRLEDADAVHAHMFGAWWAAARAVPPGVPLAASEHNALRWPGRPRLREMRAALRRVDLFFAHGPEARRLVLEAGLPAQRLRPGLAPIAGLTARPLEGLPSPRIVFAGRLHHEKGPDLLLEAVARLERPPATLILGAGDLDADLRRRSHQLGLDRVVRFVGWQPQPERYIAGASVLVVPSRHEAWSQAAVIAMGLGVPVVGTAVEGLPITLGARRGVLVPPDDPELLAGSLEGVLAGRLQTDRRGARAYASRFSSARVAAVYASAYRALVERERRSAFAA
jgi:glycosyltransferase involved in cell wall biosynthesis